MTLILSSILYLAMNRLIQCIFNDYFDPFVFACLDFIYAQELQQWCDTVQFALEHPNLKILSAHIRSWPLTVQFCSCSLVFRMRQPKHSWQTDFLHCPFCPGFDAGNREMHLQYLKGKIGVAWEEFCGTSFSATPASKLFSIGKKRQYIRLCQH